jgi:hypothetical protein
VQPADELVTDVLAAILRALLGYDLRLDAGGFDQELLLAAPFERDEPEGGVVDAVAACGDQAVILVECGPIRANASATDVPDSRSTATAPADAPITT